MRVRNPYVIVFGLPRGREASRGACRKPQIGAAHAAEPRTNEYEVQFMKSSYNGLSVPHDGEAIQYSGGKFSIPDRPIIPYIEGDGTGRDIWKASQRVFDAAVQKAYNGRRRVVWYEVFAGEKAFAKFNSWLPDDTIEIGRASCRERVRTAGAAVRRRE